MVIAATDCPAGAHPPDSIPEKMGSSLQLGDHEPNHRAVRSLASGFRYSHARGAQVGKGLLHHRERLSSAQWIHHRAHLQQSIRVGEERARGRRLRTQDSREGVSAFRTDRRASSRWAAPWAPVGCCGHPAPAPWLLPAGASPNALAAIFASARVPSLPTAVPITMLHLPRLLRT
jgi:hypothetical protein